MKNNIHKTTPIERINIFLISNAIKFDLLMIIHTGVKFKNFRNMFFLKISSQNYFTRR